MSIERWQIALMLLAAAVGAIYLIGGPWPAAVPWFAGVIVLARVGGRKGPLTRADFNRMLGDD